MASYHAEVEEGTGLTFPDFKQYKGWRGKVKLGTKALAWSDLFSTRERAQQWAVAEAKRYRDFRRQNGEGIEDVRAKKQAAHKAEHRRKNRMMEKRAAMYDLLLGFIEDFGLVPTDDLPESTERCIAKAREVVAYIDTDPQ